MDAEARAQVNAPPRTPRPRPAGARPAPAARVPAAPQVAWHRQAWAWLRGITRPQQEKSRVVFVDIGRTIAAVLVVYSHIDWVYLRQNDRQTGAVLGWLDRWVVIPLNLDEQGPGGVSVPLFFLVSGFVVTPIALRMGTARFAVNRVFRVLPLLWFALAVTIGVVLAGYGPLVSGSPEPITAPKVISSALLYTFLQDPLDAYVAVAWTLVIEILFYAMVVLLAPLLRRSPWMAIVLQLDVVIAVLLTHDWFGPTYRAVASVAAYLLIPIMGQVLWAVRQRRIAAPVGGALIAFAWLLFVWGARAHMAHHYVLRPFPVAVAVVVAVLGMLAEHRLRQRRIWVELSERSYSIYLLHGAVAFPVMQLLYGQVPVGLAVLAALAATAVVVELSYRFVERPSHRLARSLSRGRVPDFLARR